MLDERTIAVAEYGALQSQYETENSRALQEYNIYKQGEAQKTEFEAWVIERQYGMTKMQYEMGNQLLQSQMSQLDQQSKAIYDRQETQATFQKEEREFQRDIMLEDMKRSRDRAYEDQVRQLDFEDKVSLMQYDMQKQAQILDNKLRIENDRGVNTQTFTDKDGNEVAFDPLTNRTEVVYNKNISDMVSEISLYSQWVRGRKNLQCGELVNDYLSQVRGETVRGWSWWVGDTYASKVKAVQWIWQSNTPQVWGIFVSKGNSNAWHTGIITGVNSDWSINVLEANRNNTETWTEPQESTYSDTSQMVFSDTLWGISENAEISRVDIQSYNNPTFKPYTLTGKDKERYGVFLEEKSKIMEQEDAPMEDILHYSAWGWDITDSSIQKLDKYKLSIQNMWEIDDLIGKQNKENKGMWPLVWMLRGNNPRDIDAQLLEATITATIPTLARWVYGEVGVLTDRDVDLYKRTLPNIKQPEELQKAVLAMSLKKIMNGYKSSLQTLASAGRDVSLFVWEYKTLQRMHDDLMDGIPTTEPTVQLWRSDLQYNAVSWLQNADWQTVSSTDILERSWVLQQ